MSWVKTQISAVASISLAITLSAVTSTANANVTLTENEYLTFYHHDALGSPAAATDENGRVLWREASTPFGKSAGKSTEAGQPLVESNGADNETRLGYTGHTFDGGSDLVYMKARFYDPAIGRFYSNDPISFHIDNISMFNRYAYVSNNPYRYTDPTGMEGEDDQARIEREREQVNSAWNDFWGSLGSAFSSGADIASDVAVHTYSPENAAFAAAGLSTGSFLAKLYKNLRRGKNVPLGGVKFDDATQAAARNLGFEDNDIAITKGVAEFSITYLSVVSRRDFKLVEDALKAQGATAAIVNTGPIRNPTIKARIEYKLERGMSFMGFNITKTGDELNNYILDREL